MNPTVARAFLELGAHPAWGVRKGIGSFLTFEFGPPILGIDERLWTDPKGRRRRSASVHGTWHLWIEMCDWRISHASTELAHSESAVDAIAEACAYLSGQRITAADLMPNGSTLFDFDLGGRLATAAYAGWTEPEATWTLSCPGPRYLVFRSDGLYRFDENKTDEGEFRGLTDP
jgi:hypothetical protein